MFLLHKKNLCYVYMTNVSSVEHATYAKRNRQIADIELTSAVQIILS